MKNLIGLKEFRQNITSITDKIHAGETFIILKKSKPIFKISPIEQQDYVTKNSSEKGAWEEAVDFSKIKKGGVNIDELIKRL